MLKGREIWHGQLPPVVVGPAITLVPSSDVGRVPCFISSPDPSDSWGLGEIGLSGRKDQHFGVYCVADPNRPVISGLPTFVSLGYG